MDDYCELCEVCFTRGEFQTMLQHLSKIYTFSGIFPHICLSTTKRSVCWRKPLFLDDIPRIASLGCGSGIDGAAVNCVFDDFTYGGIDRVEWDTWFLLRSPLISAMRMIFIPVSENIFCFSQVPGGTSTGCRHRTCPQPAKDIGKKSVHNKLQTRNRYKRPGCLRPNHPRVCACYSRAK